jgi:hypothetical protein
MSLFNAAALGGAALAACVCATTGSAQASDARGFAYGRPAPVYVPHPDAWEFTPPGAPSGLLWAAPDPIVQERYSYGRPNYNRPAASVVYRHTRQGPVPVAIEAEYEIITEPRSRHVPDLRDSRWR